MKIWPGTPYPLGATYDGAGTNFSVFSEVAARVELCLFDESAAQMCIDFPETTGFIWHRCNPAKLLLDPYGKAVDGQVQWNEAVFPYHFNDQSAKNELDSAPFMPK